VLVLLWALPWFIDIPEVCAERPSEHAYTGKAMHEQFKVGQYVLERKLGEGGMAEVWEARHVHLGTHAAIKFLLPRLAGDPELEARFLDEGKRQSQLQHQNIVSAVDFLQIDGRSFLIMQYIEGLSLETRLKEQNGPLALEEVHSISWDVLSALDYAHSCGVVHRDVKPSNILLDKSGRVYLTDFGIALALSDEPRKTRTGAAIGTAVYMSPEQILRPRMVDARADIYSFGCVLYAMLSGGPPFGAEGETDFFIKDCHVRTSPLPLIYRNPSIAQSVEQVVLQCLEKDPAKRFQTCGAVMTALDAAISGTGIPIPTPAPTLVPAPTPVRSPTQLEAPAFRPISTPPPTPVPTNARLVPPQSVPLQAIAVQPTPVPVVSKPKSGKRYGILIAVLVCLVLAASVASYYLFFIPPDTLLRLEGSTTIGDELAPKMLVEFLKSEGATDIQEIPANENNKEHRDVRAKLAGQWRPVIFSVVANGSGSAFTALEGAKTDIGMASRPINDKEAGSLRKLGDMRSRDCENIVALDGLAVIVNDSSPLQALTRQQIGSIFRGNITNWSQIGGNPGPIHLYGRKSNSGTFDTFVALVLNGDKKSFSPSVKAEENGEQIASEVGADPNGIGYVGLAQIKGVRALQVSDGPGTASLLPSAFTIATEDYILSRRLFLYAPVQPSEFARKFINFALSPEGQKVVETVGFVTQTPRFEEVSVPVYAPAAYRARVAGLRRMSINFRFRPNGQALDNKALADVDRVVRALSQNGIRNNVQILGFADSQPSLSGNQKLSEQRAEAVADRLRANGIDVQVAGFSDAMPVGDNNTKEGQQKNRRVEIWAR
jgi:phosphate transport system substrate-binding protein